MATLALGHLLPASAPSAPSKCPFTDRLPLELRNEIFKLCFPTHRTIYLAVNMRDYLTLGNEYDDGINLDEPIGIKATISLARTCRQIGTEVMGLYCGTNMFSFIASYQMYQFLVNIGRRGRQAIRELEFAWDSPDEHNHLLILTDCHNLQRLHFGLNHWNIEDIRDYNICENGWWWKGEEKRNVDIWEWKGQGMYILNVLYHLPRDLEVKIREVRPLYYAPEQMSRFFEGPIKLQSDSLVEKYEAELKERLGYARLRG